MIGETLAQKYTLVSLLGRGGMGAVYEATDASSGARVAVKVLHPHLAEGEGQRRFRREAQAARRLRSDHIVRVLDVGDDPAAKELFLVTELLTGEDLQRAIDRGGPLSVKGALRLAIHALRGLSDAHAARVVHRDIKPANIFLARDPNGALRAKILDFGIAKVRPEALALAQSTDLTQTGSLLGSPLYMSPEQVQDSRDVDPRSDLFSLGSSLYAALAGRAPHQHLGSLGQLLVAICTAPARPLLEVAPWVPPEIAAVVQRALEIHPDKRPPSADAMLEALSPFASEGPIFEEDLFSSVDRTLPVSSLPPAPSSSEAPRIVVASPSEPPIRWDEATAHATPEIARSAVPKLSSHVVGRHVTVDSRRFLGETTELWTFSLDVHRHFSSLVARIWKALRRGGSKVPPMSYGKEWVLFEPRTGRFLEDAPPDARLSIDEAGIRPGTVLWVMVPEPRARGDEP